MKKIIRGWFPKDWVDFLLKIDHLPFSKKSKCEEIYQYLDSKPAVKVRMVIEEVE